MAIGSKGSYAVDKPIEDAIGPALKYNEQMNFRYREEDEKKKALKSIKIANDYLEIFNNSSATFDIRCDQIQ